eukprot:5634348-Amphidinium_carterae.1
MKLGPRALGHSYWRLSYYWNKPLHMTNRPEMRTRMLEFAHASAHRNYKLHLWDKEFQPHVLCLNWSRLNCKKNCEEHGKVLPKLTNLVKPQHKTQRWGTHKQLYTGCQE